MHFDSRKEVCHEIKIVHAYPGVHPPIDLCQNKRFINACTPLYLYQKYCNVIAVVRQRKDNETTCYSL